MGIAFRWAKVAGGQLISSMKYMGMKELAGLAAAGFL